MQCFTLSTEDHVAHLVLSRPEALNTMHPTFWRELDDTLTRLHREGKVRALVISSAPASISAPAWRWRPLAAPSPWTTKPRRARRHF
jgi:enoyl-CoA hydratase